MLRQPAIVAVCLLAIAVVHAGDPTTLVVCAPGYPSNTEEAQPTMDALARGIERATGWSEGTLDAAYHPTIEGGLAALGDEGAALALVPVPFYLEYRERLELVPLLRVESVAGEREVWSLVAKRGAIDAPAALAGWEIRGMAGYSPRFVRHVVLEPWGALPGDTAIVFDARVLSVVRRSARGEQVAALLDPAQSAAIGSLPYADELEVVARSQPLVGSLLCSVHARLPAARGARLGSPLPGVQQSEAGRSLLESLRISRFHLLEPDELIPVEKAFAAGAGAER